MIVRSARAALVACCAIVALLALPAASRARSHAATIVVRDAWARPAYSTGVVYATIENRGAVADRLVELASPVAGRVEMHETVAVGGGAAGPMPGMTMPAGVEMRPLSALRVPAHGAARFSPGRAHVMLIGLRRTLRAGDRFVVRMRFARAGWIATTVRVRV